MGRRRSTATAALTALRTGAVGRLAAWLGLVALVLNLAAPLAAAATVPDAFAASICHTPAPGAPDSAPGGGAQTGRSLCPLCLLAGVVGVVPPEQTAVPALGHAGGDERPVPAASQPTRLGIAAPPPASRAPPASA
ncbi:MAG: DUF2946 family protein [Magnetospirillum sp.]|nr:DUF2946 family protein [Magnetospirillum sp.]